MPDHVPAMLWYLLAVAYLVGAILVPMWFHLWLKHHTQMRVLEVLKSYAERGEEPPGSVLEALAFRGQPSGSGSAAAPRGRAEQLERFVWAAACAGAAAGVAWWRHAEGGPQWVVYAAAIAAAVCGLGALARLVAALSAGSG